MSRAHPALRAAVPLLSAVALGACSGGAAGGATGPGPAPPGNRPPIAEELEVSVRADTTRTIVLDGSDPDGHPVSYRIVDPPWNGTASLAGDTVTYTPEPGETGPDSFTYTVSDGWTEAERPAYVWITIQDPSYVNAAPLVGDARYWTEPGKPLALTLAGYDPDGDPLSFAILQSPGRGTLAGSGAARTYTPAPGWVGSDAFAYSVDDGSGPVAARVTISVAPRPSFRAMTAAERLATLDALDAKAHELGAITPASVGALEAHARTLPGVAYAGSDPSGIWGQLADGVVFMIGVDATVAATTAQAAARPASPPAPAAVALGYVPSRNRAVLINGFPVDQSWGADPSAVLGGILADGGYTVDVRPGSVADFIIRDASVVHIRTHGGSGLYFDSTGTPAGQIESLWTTTPNSPGMLALYENDLLTGHLTLMQEDVAPGVKEWHIGVAPKFVEREWRLALGAYVHASSCWLGEHATYHPRGGPFAPTRSALQKAILSSGAQLFAGWTRATEVAHLDKVAKYVFDRMLGANTVAPVESPPQRPMGAASILKELRAKGLDLNLVDRGSSWTSAFRFLTPQGERLRTDRLAPSIARLEPDVANRKLYVKGDLQPYWLSDPAALRCSIDGIESQATTQLGDVVCDLPADASGDVQVIVDGRRSNRVRLSSWSGTLTYEITGPGSLRQTWTFPVRLLGDVHRYRAGAGETPGRHEKTYVVMKAQGSSGSFTATGEHEDARYRVTWSGGGSITPNVTPTACDGCFALFGQAIPETPDSLWWNMFVGFESAYHQALFDWDEGERRWVLNSSGSLPMTFPAFSGMTDTSGLPTGMFALKVPATIGPDGTLLGGVIGPEELRSGLGDHTGWSFQHEFRWTTMTPASYTEIDPEMPR
jgi:hypothetical protein